MHAVWETDRYTQWRTESPAPRQSARQRQIACWCERAGALVVRRWERLPDTSQAGHLACQRRGAGEYGIALPAAMRNPPKSRLGLSLLNRCNTPAWGARTP